jgi:hypothetical protein
MVAPRRAVNEKALPAPHAGYVRPDRWNTIVRKKATDERSDDVCDDVGNRSTKC